MSPSPSLLRRLRRTPGSDGFSLIEVVVAIGILVLVIGALLPQVIVGIRATATAKGVTQAKGVAQARLELMRSLPFHVSPAAGDYIDVLDTYYRNSTAPTAAPACTTGQVYTAPQETWTGFVSAANPKRCDYEPGTGAFYRKVVPNITAPGLGVFTLVVNTVFLSSSVPPQPVAPIAGYNSQTAGKDIPASSQVGVWVTVVHQPNVRLKPVTTYTQISQRNPAEARIQTEAATSTVRVSSHANDGTHAYGEVMTLEAGVVNQSGSLYTGSRVTGLVSAVNASSSLGDRAEGATKTISAPPSLASADQFRGTGSLAFGCLFVCFGNSAAENLTATAADGLPRAGTPTAPLRAVIPTGTGQDGFRYNNGPDAASALGLASNRPMVRLDTGVSAAMPTTSNCTFTGSTRPAYLVGTGYLDATPHGDPLTPGSVSACATAQTAPVVLFPTDWAPEGIVRIVLKHASVLCLTSGNGDTQIATAQVDYEAVVQRWNGSAYVDSGLITEVNPADVLASIPLTASVGGGRTLGDYISSWRAASAGDLAVNSTNGATVRVPGIVTIDTQPTRASDPDSVISLTVGTLSCTAKDNR